MEKNQLHEAIDKLSDSEAERCLQTLVQGFAVRKGYEDLVTSEAELKSVIDQYSIAAYRKKEVAKEPEPPPPPPIDPAKVADPANRPAGVRAVLHAMADDDELRPKLDSWFTSGRPTLVEPITTALVLAGIVFVLSVDIKLKVKKDKDGKVEWEVNLEKEPTKESLLEKFFGLFG